MTTLLVNINDDKKVDDVVSFLRDIDFLEVLVKSDQSERPPHRSPAKELLGTRILGDIMESVVPNSDWEVQRDATS